jgi:hypothetical protein
VHVSHVSVSRRVTMEKFNGNIAAALPILMIYRVFAPRPSVCPLELESTDVKRKIRKPRNKSAPTVVKHMEAQRLKTGNCHIYSCRRPLPCLKIMPPFPVQSGGFAIENHHH